MIASKMKIFTCLLVVLHLNVACTAKKSGTVVTVYTSTYKEIIALYEPKLKAKFPDIEVQWFQAGSEQVASRINAEMAGGGTAADIIMTSDLFFFQELKKAGKLATIESSQLASWPKEDVDPDKKIIVTRFPMMVIAVNTKKVPPEHRPKSFADLLKPEYKGMLTMPSPLESGSTLTSTMFLFNRLGGESYFKGLRKNDIVAAGGNGSAFSRVKSGEKPIAIVLMENVLQDRERNNVDWVDFVVPSEGALPIPSPVAILQSSHQPQAAQKVLEWFLSSEAQDILVKGWVYSPLPSAAAPKGGPAWKDLKMQNWSLSLFQEWSDKRQNVKDLFQNLVLSN